MNHETEHGEAGGSMQVSVLATAAAPGRAWVQVLSVALTWGLVILVKFYVKERCQSVSVCWIEHLQFPSWLNKMMCLLQGKKVRAGRPELHLCWCPCAASLLTSWGLPCSRKVGKAHRLDTYIWFWGFQGQLWSDSDGQEIVPHTSDHWLLEWLS